MKRHLPHFILGLAALGACGTIPRPDESPISSVAERQRIETRASSERVEIPVAAGDTILSAGARASLLAFADNYLRYGHGALVLSTPSGGANADAASTLALQARMSLLEAGVSYAAVAGATYDAAGAANAPIIVSFARFEAHAPECTQPWDDAGCAAQANLAAMAGDPRHPVMRAYGEGPTHADRSSGERVAASNAVN